MPDSQRVTWTAFAILAMFKMILGLVIVHFHQQVVGTTGRGKTTTMNLFTGNKVSFLEKRGSTIIIRSRLLQEAWPTA